MKNLLFIVILLISTLQLNAQQRDYYDCVADGYKGHVKQVYFNDSNNPYGDWLNGNVVFNKNGSCQSTNVVRDQKGYILKDSTYHRKYAYKDGRRHKITAVSYSDFLCDDRTLETIKKWYIEKVATYSYNNKGQEIQLKILSVDYTVKQEQEASFFGGYFDLPCDTLIQTYSYSNIVEDPEGNWINRSYTMTDNKGHHKSGTQKREIVYYWSERPSPMSKDNRKREKLDEIQLKNIDMALKYGDDIYKINANIFFSLEEIAPRGSGEYHMVVRLQNTSTREDFMHEDFPVKGSSFQYSNNEDFSEYFFSFNSTIISFKLNDKLHSYNEPSQLKIKGVDDNNSNKEILFLCGVHVYNENKLLNSNPIQLFFSNCKKHFSK